VSNSPTRRFDRSLAIAAFVTAHAVSASCLAGEDATATTTSAPVDEVVLDVGEQKVLSANDVRSYSEGVRGVIDVRLTKDGSEFVLVALAPGQTTLLFLLRDGSERHYRIRVVDHDAAAPIRRAPGVEARENIRLDFYFVQVDKTFGYRIGLGFPGSIAPTFSARFDVQAGALDGATAVVTNQALPRLDMAQTSGWAKVLRQAAVVTANGAKATFAGGQEINVLVQGALSTGVERIQAGSSIEVEPVYDASSGRIELRVHAELSDFQGDRGTGVPGRVTSALDTIVNLELGQSMVLAGLTARSERSDKTGLPGLSQIPILGALFGSHSHTEDETENVAIIVPSVVDTASMQSRERIAYALARYLDYSGDFEAAPLVPEAHPRRKGQP
jgi:pilus assembly protein CpaC